MKPALLVIDCQNDFKKDASPYACAMLTPELVERTRTLVAFCRERNVPIVYTQHSIKPDKSNAEFGEPEDVRACIVGTEGWEIIEALKPHTGDIVAQKDKYDAFYGAHLNEELRKLYADTLILCGVLTNNCVRATAEGAHYRNFKLVVVSDCSGATSYLPDRTHEEIHDITLCDLKERMYETEIVTLADMKKIF